MAWLGRRAAVLEQHMRNRRYLVGSSITIADYSMIRFESYRSKTPFDWSPYPAINAYFDQIRATDSWVRTTPDLSAIGRKPKAAA